MSFFAISIFFIPDGTKEIFTITFSQKKNSLPLCSSLKMDLCLLSCPAFHCQMINTILPHI